MNRARVRLRGIRPDDWEAVHSWARLESASRFQAWGPNTVDQTRAFVAEAVAAWAQEPPSRLSFVALLGRDGGEEDEGQAEIVGAGELKIRSFRQRQGEISYLVHPVHWGRGLGTAVGRELLNTGFADHGLHRIYATCDPRNVGSGRVLAKLGLRYEGRMRHTTYISDGWRDSDLYAVLEDEWRPAT